MVIFHSYVKLPEGTYWPGLLLGTIYIHLPHPFSNRKEMDIRIRHRRQSQEPPVDHQEIMVRPEFLVFLHVLWVSLNKGHVTWSKKNIHQKKHQKIFRDHLSQHPLLISVDCLLYRSPQPISEWLLLVPAHLPSSGLRAVHEVISYQQPRLDGWTLCAWMRSNMWSVWLMYM